MRFSCLSITSTGDMMMKKKFFRFLVLTAMICSMTLTAQAGQWQFGRHSKPMKRCLPSKIRYCPQTKQILGPEISLLAENSLDGWTTIGGKQPPEAWNVTNGVLHLKGKGGDIITDREFENYQLDFVWTISKGGNSGIKYRFKKFEGKGWLGPEFQVLDDFNTGEGKKPKNNTSTLYDILPTNDKKSLNPHTEKNYGRIIVNGDNLQHWLNGKKVVDVRVGSNEWNEAIAKSKFNNIEGFGANELGRIMVQDHQCEVWFHKISIREIEKTTTSVKTTNMSRKKSCSPKHVSKKCLVSQKTCYKKVAPKTSYYRTKSCKPCSPKTVKYVSRKCK